MPDGDRLDDSLDDDGIAIFGSHLQVINYGVAVIDHANRIVLAGDGRGYSVVRRLEPSGFTEHGGLYAIIDAVHWNDVAVDRHGRVVVVGYDSDFTDSTLDPDHDFVVARYYGEPFLSVGSGLGCPTCSYAPPAVCGNGIFEFGEQCDDGNTVAGDACSDTCETELDLDADGLLDPGDACVNAGGTQDFLGEYPSRITVTRSTTSAGTSETLSLSGVFEMPSGWRFEDFDPNGIDRYSGGRGVGLVVTNGYPSRILAKLVIDDGPSRFWTRSSSSEWSYVNHIPDDGSPVLSLVIRDEGEGRLSVSAGVRKSAFQGAVGSSLEVPLNAVITLGRLQGAGQHAECGESHFEATDCSWNAAGTKLSCQPAGAPKPPGPACGIGAELALLLPLLLAWRRRGMQGTRPALRA
jgi:cysteine-rich repeat protein